MNQKRSLNAQRARILEPKSSSKPISNKFVKKEILNMKYGLQNSKSIKPKKPINPLYLSSTIFTVSLLATIFFIPPAISLTFAAILAVIVTKLVTQKKIKIAPINKRDYHLNDVLLSYDNILQGTVKEELIQIHELMKKISQYNLEIKEKYYLESIMTKDIPTLLLNYKEVYNDDEAKEKLVTALLIIKSKLYEINSLYMTDYKQKIEITKRVIEEKSLG